MGALALLLAMPAIQFCPKFIVGSQCRDMGPKCISITLGHSAQGSISSVLVQTPWVSGYILPFLCSSTSADAAATHQGYTSGFKLLQTSHERAQLAQPELLAP